MKLQAIGGLAQVNPRPSRVLDDSAVVTFLPMKSVQELNGHIDTSDTRKIVDVRKGYTSFEENDVLFAKITPCMENGKIAIARGLAGGIGYGSTEFHVLRCGSSLDSKYLFYYLVRDSFRIEAKRNMGGAVGQLRVPKRFLEEFLIPFFPLARQEEIAAKIEELFSELDKSIHSLERELDRCIMLKASIIEHAYGGASSKRVKLSEVTEVITDGDHQAPPRSESGIPFIVISNIINNRVALERSTRYVPDYYYEKLKGSRKPKEGDVLYTVTGSYGIPALIEGDDKFCFQRHIALLRPDSTKISSKYLLYALQTDSVRKQATSIATGTAQLTVPLTGLRKINIPLIAFDKQVQLVGKIEMKLSELENMRSAIHNSILLAKNMKQSILTKAFKGELV